MNRELKYQQEIAQEELSIFQDLGPFGIQPSELEEIFNLNLKRKFCEELDYL